MKKSKNNDGDSFNKKKNVIKLEKAIYLKLRK